MNKAEVTDGQCHFYLPRKHRYCRFRPKEGQQYCPEHACVKGVHGERKRIPCPLNPNHNCYEDELEKHVKKCNVAKIRQAHSGASYYVKGINRRTVNTQIPCENSKKMCVKDMTSTDLAAMIDRVNALYEEHVEKIETVVYEHPCVKEEYCGHEEDLSEALGEQAALRKELLQQASLVGQLDKMEFLADGQCFVELGAGKGKLSHWIQKASKNCTNNSFLLIDRSSVRYKMDSFHKQGSSESVFKRLKIDIEDLCLGGVEIVNSSDSVIVVGKHLCGGATDMGIRCAVETLGTEPLSTAMVHSDGSVPDFGALKHQGVLDCGPSLNTSASSIVYPQCSERLEKNVSMIHTSSTADAPADASTLHPSSSHSKNSVTSPENMSDNPIQQNRLAADVSKTTNEHRDKINNCDSICGTLNLDKKTAGDDKSIVVDQNRVTHTEQNDCDFPDLQNGQEPPSKVPKLENKDSIQKLPKGIVIALCCHHRCTWDTYTGKDFMHACGVSPMDFDLLTRLSSWATCAKVTAKSTRARNINKESSESMSDKDRKTRENYEGGIMGTENKSEDLDVADFVSLDGSKSLREQLSVKEREDIGDKCKRLLDTGRLRYLKSKGMECFLHRYISEELTPENIVLVAYRPTAVKT